MRKQQKIMNRNSTRKLGSLRFIAILAAIAVIATAAVTVLSRQRAGADKFSRQNTSLAAPNAKNFVTLKVAGQDVKVDGGTGQIKPLTQEEAQAMVAGISKLVNQSTEGLTQVENADGSVSLDLEDRFQNVTIARQNQDGTLSTSCVDNTKAAARFFAVEAPGDSTDENRRPTKAPVRAGDR